MKMIKLIPMLSLLLLMACGVDSSDKENVEAMIARAEKLRQQAAMLEHEWSNHAPIIAAARKALASDNLAEARSKAELAIRLGEQSIAQAEQSEKDWQTFLPQ